MKKYLALIVLIWLSISGNCQNNLETDSPNRVIFAGGSAGSICWFENGISDSRPRELSIVNGLSFLKYSQCPHYSGIPIRRNMYQEKILNGTIHQGYGCDDLSGILFVNGKFQKAVSLNDKNNSYFLSVKNGVIIEEKLQTEIIR